MDGEVYCIPLRQLAMVPPSHDEPGEGVNITPTSKSGGEGNERGRLREREGEIARRERTNKNGKKLEEIGDR